MPKSVTFASPSGVSEDVLRLHVAVHEAVLVCERERIGDLQRELDRPARRQRAGPLDELLEILAVDVLEDDVLLPAVLPAVDHGDDVRVGELGDGAGLPPEALDVLLVVGVVLMQHLECDVALEQLVARAVDARHAAGPHELLELVALGDQLTGHGAGSGGEGARGHEGRTRKPPWRLRENRFERLFPGVERLVQLRIGDHERTEDADAVRMDACP